LLKIWRSATIIIGASVARDGLFRRHLFLSGDEQAGFRALLK
jgi:hypothetical protein